MHHVGRGSRENQGADSKENQGSDDPSRETTPLSKRSRNRSGVRRKPRRMLSVPPPMRRETGKPHGRSKEISGTKPGSLATLRSHISLPRTRNPQGLHATSNDNAGLSLIPSVRYDDSIVEPEVATEIILERGRNPILELLSAHVQVMIRSCHSPFLDQGFREFERLLVHACI